MMKEEKMDNSRLNEYIRSYQELLQEKGYTESSLNSGAPPGTVAANIEKGLRAVIELSEGEEEGLGVMVQTFGRFGPNNEIIKFDFAFAYNRKSDTITLELMNVGDDTIETTCVPKLAGSIPDLQTAVVLFKEERVKLLLRQIKQPVKRPNGRRL